MTANTANTAKSGRPGILPRFYVATWMALAGVSLSYLTLLAARPDIAASVRLVPPAGSAIASSSETSTDVRSLQQTVSALEGEIQALRTALGTREEREQVLAARLAAIEAGRSTLLQPTPVATTSERANPRATAGEELSGRTVSGRIEEGEATKVAAAPAAAQPGAVAFGAPQVTPSRPTGIVIASGPSVDSLRLSWMLLSDRHKAVLKDLEPRFVATRGGTNPAYRLVAGPVSDERAAQRLCGQLRARRVTCGIGAYTGEPL